MNRLNASGLSALHVAVNRGIGQRHRQRAIHLLAAAGANLDATTPLGPLVSPCNSIQFHNKLAFSVVDLLGDTALDPCTWFLPSYIIRLG